MYVTHPNTLLYCFPSNFGTTENISKACTKNVLYATKIAGHTSILRTTSSPLISPANRPNKIKPVLQTPTEMSPLASIEPTKAFHYSKQTYSLCYTHQTQKKR